MHRYVILVLIVILEVKAKQWIDPHEMNFDTDIPTNINRNKNSNYRDKNREWKDPYSMNLEDPSIDARIFKERWTNQEQSDTCSKTNGEIQAYMKRFVNLIVRSMVPDNSDNSDKANIKGSITFDITEENFKFLSEFSKLTTINTSTLKELDSVLTISLQRPFFDTHAIKSVFKRLGELIFNESVQFFAIISLLIVFTIICYIKRVSVMRFLKYVAFGIFLISAYLMYLHEVQKNDHFNGELCKDTSWWAYFFGESKECKKKQKTEIFLIVVGDIVKGLVVKPLSFLGTAGGQFTFNFFKDLSWLEAIFFAPMLLGLLFMFVICMIPLLCGKTIDLNIFNLLRIRFYDPIFKYIDDRGMQSRVEDIDERALENKKTRKSPKRYINDKSSTNKVKVEKKSKSNDKLDDKSEDQDKKVEDNKDESESEEITTKEHIE